MLKDKNLLFSTSLDKLAMGVTVGVTLLFALIIFIPFFFYANDIGLLLSVGLVLSLIYFIAYGFSPSGYLLTEDKVIIRSLFRNIYILKADIKNIERIDKEKLSGSIRTFAVGGLFGYFGKFVNSQFGQMTWYVTRLDKAILITTIDGQKIVVSPDDAENFIADFP